MPTKPRQEGTAEEKGRLLSQGSEDSHNSDNSHEHVRAITASRGRKCSYQRLQTSIEVVENQDMMSCEDADRDPTQADSGVTDQTHPLNGDVMTVASEAHNVTKPDTSVTQVEGPSVELREKASLAVHSEDVCLIQQPDHPEQCERTSSQGSQRSSVDRGRESLSEKSSSHGHQHRQRVVYYQNRFITVNIDPKPIPVTSSAGQRKRGKQQTTSARQENHTGANSVSSANLSEVSGQDINRSKNDGANSVDTHQRETLTIDATTAGQHDNVDHGLSEDKSEERQTNNHSCSADVQTRTMQPIPGTSSMGDPIAPMGSLSAIPGVMNLGPNPSPVRPSVAAGKPKKDTFFAQICKLLQDNRVQHGDKEAEMKLKSINRSQDNSNVILKKILNIIFLTTGVALLIGVIVVIVYTSVSSRCPGLKDVTGAETMDECGTHIGTLCRFRCLDGYELMGSEERLCRNDSTWSGEETSCVYTGKTGHEPGYHDYLPITEIPPGSVYDLDDDTADGNPISTKPDGKSKTGDNFWPSSYDDVYENEVTGSEEDGYDEDDEDYSNNPRPLIVPKPRNRAISIG